MGMRSGLAAAVLVGCLASAAVAQPVEEALLELVAVGGFADPHDIHIVPGTTVTLAYQATHVENWNAFQDNISVTDLDCPLTLVPGASWWEGLAFARLAFGFQTTTDQYIVLGTIVAPMGSQQSFSAAGPVDVAVLEITCDAPGHVVVQGLHHAVIAQTDPATADLIGRQPVSAFSNATVTIHAGPGWDVAEGQESVGHIVPTSAGDLLELLALPFDPTAHEFWHWEETTGAGLGEANPFSPLLVTRVGEPLELVAHFVEIPEPATAMLLALGLGAAAVRRRRRGGRGVSSREQHTM
ncbi:PEP-CTERM sorting domain-containing protein [Planctomycetota bacterium]